MTKQPIVLAFETTFPKMSVTLIGSDGERINFIGDGQVSSSNELLTAAAALLRQNKLELSDLGLLAVCAGPGSFTGIRVGLATTQALAYGLGCKSYGVSILEALALMAAGAETGFRKIIAAVGAGKNQVYVQTFLKNKQGRINYSDSNPHLINIADLNIYVLQPETLIIAEKKCASEISTIENNTHIMIASDNVSEFIALRGMEILHEQNSEQEFARRMLVKEEKFGLNPIYLRNFRIGQ